jgi:hypothetical protein
MFFSWLRSDSAVETGLDEQLRAQRRHSVVVDETLIEVAGDRVEP